MKSSFVCRAVGVPYEVVGPRWESRPASSDRETSHCSQEACDGKLAIKQVLLLSTAPPQNKPKENYKKQRSWRRHSSGPGSRDLIYSQRG